ncbi:iron chaperone [Lacisediminihabitans sp.]|uniref:iron chaperone n=1 Tax=Lacisediminihabitans sp. TaxID=2787631 RepID=UPI00374D124C
MGSVDDTLAGLPEAAGASLRHIVDVARGIAPGAEDGVSYGVPALRVAGKPLIGVSASAKHLSVFPFSPAAIDSVRDRLGGFSLSKGTVRFTPEHPIPDDVLGDLVRARLTEIVS